MTTIHLSSSRLSDKILLNKLLLYCGISSTLWYFAINIYVPMQYESYSLVTYTVSELSAIGAPTRKLWVGLALLYPLLLLAFGWGVLRLAEGNRPLCVVGKLIIAYSIINFYWPPMHMRGEEMALTDILHIVWGMITVLFVPAVMGIGAAAFGKGFRLYSIASIVLHVVLSILIGLEAPNLATNGPTPMIGVWERIDIAIFMIWFMVLALVLLHKEKLQHSMIAISE